MSFDIFRVDWITVDSIIIISLILILIAIKSFKRLIRWRFSIANENLNQSKFSGSLLSFNSQNIKINYWNNIKNGSYGKNPTLIFIIRTKRKIRALQALIEGLASFGLNVIDLKIEILSNDRTKNDLIGDLKGAINSIFDFMDLKNQKDYISITFREKPVNTCLKDKNCQFQVFINPKNSQMDYDMLISQLKSSDNSHLVLSEYLLKFIKNRWIQYSHKVNKIPDSHLSLIKNSTRNFKYNETVLFGVLIEIITQILNKD
ncbi:MAG: hypothetical protein EU533_03465 [Promethearchaeota archaeon]|nr:MAG: hypothetical protein EU533_03465 [Candidatus Lokiarchaeota archaeon]